MDQVIWRVIRFRSVRSSAVRSSAVRLSAVRLSAVRLRTRSEINYATYHSIATSIGDIDLENQDVQSEICIGCSVTSPKCSQIKCNQYNLDNGKQGYDYG